MKIHELYENSIHKEDLDNLVNGEYSQAFKRAMDGYYIFKGFSNTEVTSQDILKLSPIENRKSANTKNYYTLWLNNDDDWKRFPKRNVICSSTYKYSLMYGKPYVILPKNDTVIGVCPEPDFWQSFDIYYMPSDLNRDTYMLLMNADISDTVPESYEDLLSYLKKFDSLSLDKREENLYSYAIMDDTYKVYVMENGLYNFYKKYYYPINFTTISVSEFNVVNNRELWFDNDFIAIEHDVAEKIFSEYRRSKQ